MTLHLKLIKYLLLCVLVNQTFLAPIPNSVNLLNSDSFKNSRNSIIKNQNEIIERRSSDNVNSFISLLLDDVAISKYRNEFHQKNNVKKKQVKHENNKNQGVSKRIYEIQMNNDKLKSLSTEKQEDSDTSTPFISIPFSAVFTITQDNVREPEETSFEETRDPPDAFSPCFDKKYSRREIPGNPKFSSKSKDTLQKHEIAGPVNLLKILRLITKKRHVDPLDETDSTTDSKPRNHIEECGTSSVIEFEDENIKPQVNETSERQEIDDDDEESEGSLGSIADLVPVIIPVLQDLSDPNTDTDLASVVGDSIPILDGLLGNDSGLLNMIATILLNVFGGTKEEGSDILAFVTPLVGPLLQIAGPLLGTIGGPIVSAILNIVRSEDSLSSIVKAVVENISQVDANGNSPILDTIVDVAVGVFKDLRPGLPGGLDVAGLVEGITAGTITGTFAASDSSAGYGGKPQPYGPYGSYGSYGSYGTNPETASSNSIFRTNREIADRRQKTTSSFLRKSPPKKRRPSSVTSISHPANNVKHQRITDRTTRRPYVAEASVIYPSSSTLLQNFGQYHITGPVQAGSNTDSGSSSYLPHENNGVPAYGVNPLGLVISSIKDVFGDGIQLLSSLINVVFGISGASSADKPQGYGYGPPPYAGTTKAP